jgi:hypothetical protein
LVRRGNAAATQKHSGLGTFTRPFGVSLYVKGGTHGSGAFLIGLEVGGFLFDPGGLDARGAASAADAAGSDDAAAASALLLGTVVTGAAPTASGGGSAADT